MNDSQVAAIDTSFGQFVAWFSRTGLCRLRLPRPEVAPVEVIQLGRPNAALVAQLSVQIGEYLEGKRRSFDVPLELASVQGFTRRVLEEMVRVPYGTVISYGALGARCGNANAARAVGAAMRNNPIPLLIPCHRVIAAGGGIGGYTPGLHWKRRLFELEGIDLSCPVYA